MRYPCLVPGRVCKTPIHLVIEGEGIDENGAPETVFEGELFCNWQDGGYSELSAEQKYTRVEGRAYFSGDICPEVGHITSGWGMIFGERREIVRGVKARNPDGSVNYTEVRFR